MIVIAQIVGGPRDGEWLKAEHDRPVRIPIAIAPTLLREPAPDHPTPNVHILEIWPTNTRLGWRLDWNAATRKANGK